MFNEFADEAEKRGEVEEAARFRNVVEPVYSGQIAYRGLVPTSALSEEIIEYTKAPLLVCHLCFTSCHFLTDGRITLQLLGKNGVGGLTYMRLEL